MAEGKVGRRRIRPPRSWPPRPAMFQQTLNQKTLGRAAARSACASATDSFFRASTSAGGDDACAAQCPDAPTARYTEPAGSDRIEDAVSTSGAPYTALPVANHYQTTLDNTCRCYRSPTRGYSAAVLNDPTLRRGDVVVTLKGFLVFQGACTRSITPSDFVAFVPSALSAQTIARRPGRHGASRRVATSSRRLLFAKRVWRVRAKC